MIGTCRRCGRTLEFVGEPPSFCAYCGQPLSAPEPDATIEYSPDPNRSPPSGGRSHSDAMPDQVAGYRLIRKLGDGGMGQVFEAEEVALGRRVALKVLSPRYETGPEAIERFRLEGRLASTITHPRCVFVLAADEADGCPYIVMELMTGSTLQTLVESSGALPVETAVSKILDVIEGLIEAHRRGVIHRDVKPSNCFLEVDGRVKVGDFGLSKSLNVEASLTRTGSFIGTPMYASPEQIKVEPLDLRTDVYSVAATLYFLLAGRPPFEAPDASATLARIVSESPGSLRALRGDVPAALEAAIFKGMDRDRDRRWKNLEEFRLALLPFAPHPVLSGEIGPRVGAFLIDLVPLFVLGALSVFVLGRDGWLHVFASIVLWVLYFAPLEGVWGQSLGKRLLRLKVCRTENRIAPGVARAGLRALVLYGILEGPEMVATALFDRWTAASESWLLEPGSALLSGLMIALSCTLLVSTMRITNGFQGPHELLSGTRVVRVPRLRRRREPNLSRRPLGRERGSSVRPIGVLQQVGPYRVRGAVRWESTRKVLSAEDSGLGREVWLMMRPRSSPPLPTSRRDLNRTARPRWLSGGEQGENRWDAFVAPSGCSLADWAGPTGLPWDDARQILHDLSEELEAAVGDGTLPSGLTVDQVWISTDGRTQLIDPLGASAEGSEDSASDDRRALRLVRQTAALALEGGRRRRNDDRGRIAVAVPIHARELLDRLFGIGRPYHDVSEFRKELDATRERPTELSASTRVGRVWCFLLFLLIKFWVVLGLAQLLEGLGLFQWMDQSGLLTGLSATVIPPALVLWVGWGMATRGGLTPYLLRAALVRSNGSTPSRLRCGLRELILWVPLLTLIAACDGLEVRLLMYRAAGWLVTSLWFVPAIWPLVSAAYEVFDPGRMLHDKLSGTCLVPK